ncbi:MAG: SDR family oxidoreductase [Promethearchaeota archaeon]|nr:MAG: SDR family oxidoreductase [Candidatus Lokiarchaeota archaeon]
MRKKYFKNKNAVVTGAASGVGKEISLKLAKMGTNLVISDINMERLEQVKNKAANFGVKVISAKCDVTDQNQVKDLVKIAMNQMDEIHFLFSNAGIYMGGPFEHFSMDQWNRIMEVNVWGMIFVVKGFINKFLEQGFGHVIITSSIAGSLGAGAVTAYSTTKFANSGFGEAIYGEYYERGLNVSIVCPFPLRTNLIENFQFSFPPEIFDGLEEDAIERGLKAAKSYYWKEFTKKGSGFFGGFEVERAVKRIMKKIRKKKLYIFDRRYGRFFQYLRGFSPWIYKKILNLAGKRHNELVEQSIEEFKKAARS